MAVTTALVDFEHSVEHDVLVAVYITLRVICETKMARIMESWQSWMLKRRSSRR